jgi:flagellar hook-associated protein 3 FlgL
MNIRITDSYMASILLGDLNRGLGNLLEQQRMAGSMRRINSFADDPRAVGTIQRYNALIANNDEYLANVGRNRNIVDATDTALQSVSDTLAQVRELVLRESSALSSNQTAVVEVDNLVDRLMDILNTNVEGNYIFSGRQVFTPPFVRSGDTVLYQGDSGEMLSRVGPNATMAVNLAGDALIGARSSSLGGSVDLAPRLQATTLLSELNLGQGWQRGAVSISDGDGNLWQVDLSTATTVGDVLNTITTGTGGLVTASLNADGTAITFTGTGPLTVGEVGGGMTASSLGINATAAGGLLEGRDVRPAAGPGTLLADIAALSGRLPLGTIDVTWQGTTYNVDLSAATTLADIQAAFAATVPGMEIQVRDSSLVVIGGSTDVFQLANGDAADSATALGINGQGGPVRLFGMLEDLRAALETGDKAAIRATANEISSLEDLVQRLLMKTGGRQNSLDWSEDVLRQRDERLRGNLSLEQDIDVAKVAADLNRAETTYQASLLVASKLYQTNLMQYLR